MICLDMVWHILTGITITALIIFWIISITANITVAALIVFRINKVTYFLNSTESIPCEDILDLLWGYIGYLGYIGDI